MKSLQLLGMVRKLIEGTIDKALVGEYLPEVIVKQHNTHLDGLAGLVELERNGKTKLKQSTLLKNAAIPPISKNKLSNDLIVIKLMEHKVKLPAAIDFID